MSGDRLAQAKERIEAALDGGVPLLLPEDRMARRKRAEDALDALVEIARGMERIEKTCDVVVQRIAEVGEPPAALSGTQIDAERMRDFARAALARLDRPSSDGTEDSGAAE